MAVDHRIILMGKSLDFVAFVIQLIGGSLAGPTAPAEDQLRAIHIYMGGIGLQQFFIVIFVAFAIKFQLEVRNINTSRALSTSWRSGWRPLLFTLYASLICITVSVRHRRCLNTLLTRT